MFSSLPRLARGGGALLLLLIARSPQSSISWGGVPTILSAALVFYVLAETLKLLEQRDGIRAARMGMIAAGAVLTHLLPAVSHRKIMDPHYSQFWYEREFERWRSVQAPGYVFLGARPIPKEHVRYRAEDLERIGARLLYRKGEARLYKLRP